MTTDSVYPNDTQGLQLKSQSTGLHGPSATPAVVDAGEARDRNLGVRLRELASQMADKGAFVTKDRVEELALRLDSGDTRVRVALCGLFSAGKSSLINSLTQNSTLATGAVPTTAEVEDVIWETNGVPLVLMDTPGIDSTDEAHQAATDAAMHLADVVLLVLDYAHVESEENLEFARQLTARRKQLFIVVNQIDKHSDFELSFEDFSRRVTQSLEDEGVVYEGIFYTSSRPSVHSQLDNLRAALSRLGAGGSATVLKSVRETALGLVDEALDAIYADKEWDSETALLESCGRTPLHMEEAQSWQEELESKNRARELAEEERLRELQLLQEQAEEGFLRSIELGQIAPYATTELGRKYVESLRDDFKVGWIGAQKKTAEERERRLETFLTDLRQTTLQNLVWPLQREMRSFLYSFEFGGDDAASDIDGLFVDISRELLEGAVHHGALGNGQYPYQYVKEVVGRVKAEIRRSLQRILDKWWLSAANQLADEGSLLTEEDAAQVKEYHALRDWISIREERHTLQQVWFRLVDGGEEGKQIGR